MWYLLGLFMTVATKSWSTGPSNRYWRSCVGTHASVPIIHLINLSWDSSVRTRSLRVTILSFGCSSSWKRIAELKFSGPSWKGISKRWGPSLKKTRFIKVRSTSTLKRVLSPNSSIQASSCWTSTWTIRLLTGALKPFTKKGSPNAMSCWKSRNIWQKSVSKAILSFRKPVVALLPRT